MFQRPEFADHRIVIKLFVQMWNLPWLGNLRKLCGKLKVIYCLFPTKRTVLVKKYRYDWYRIMGNRTFLVVCIPVYPHEIPTNPYGWWLNPNEIPIKSNKFHEISLVHWVFVASANRAKKRGGAPVLPGPRRQVGASERPVITPWRSRDGSEGRGG